jgi:hypothetical protein
LALRNAIEIKTKEPMEGGASGWSLMLFIWDWKLVAPGAYAIFFS